MIGDIRELPDGRIEVVIEETVIYRLAQESKEEEAARLKKGLPAPIVSYTAVKVERRGG